MHIATLIAADYPDAKRIGERYKQGLKSIRESGAYLKILENDYGQGQVPSHLLKELERFDYIYNFDAQE